MIGIWFLQACQPYTVNLPYDIDLPPPPAISQAVVLQPELRFDALWTADGIFLEEQAITVQNRGDAPLQIIASAIRPVLTDPGAEAEATLFEVSAPGSSTLAPGDATTLLVRYRPVDLLLRRAEVHIATTDAANRELVVPVYGEARGPRAELSGSCPEATPAGCADLCTLLVRNTGTDTLRVDSVQIEGVDLLSTDGLQGADPLPWYIPPGAVQRLPLQFAPQEAVWTDARIHLQTNDAEQPAPVFALPTRSPGPVEVADMLTVPGGKGDILLLIDADKPMRDSLTAFQQHLPALLDALDATGLDWRMAIQIDDSGCVDGPVAYVSAGKTRPHQIQGLVDMMDAAPGLLSGAGFQRAALALQPWLLQPGNCNDGLHRSNVPVDIVGISSRAEHSTGTWSDHVSRIGSLAGAGTRFHAIAGITPSGCEGMEPGYGWYDAAEATGGRFESLCGDMGEALRGIGLSLGGDRTAWPLSDVPEPATLEVEIDGLSQGTGWSYDAELNRVVFDLEAAPAFGSAVTLRYVAEAVCE